MGETPSPSGGDPSEESKPKAYIPDWRAAPLTDAEIRKLPSIAEEDFEPRERPARKGPELLDSRAYLELEESEPDPFLPSDEELPAMQAWIEQNKEQLSKMTKRKQRTARFDALQELRAQRAREQIAASSSDDKADTDPEGSENT